MTGPCSHCGGSRIVAGPGEYTTAPCPFCIRPSEIHSLSDETEERLRRERDEARAEVERLKGECRRLGDDLGAAASARVDLEDWLTAKCAEVSSLQAELLGVREETLRQVYFALKTRLGKGEHQRVLNDVIDEMRSLSIPSPREKEGEQHDTGCMLGKHDAIANKPWGCTCRPSKGRAISRHPGGA